MLTRIHSNDTGTGTSNPGKGCQGHTNQSLQIPVGGYTHLNFAFLYIHPDTYELVPMESNQTDLYARFAALKNYGVEPWISIGGWAMNNPGPYAEVFTTLAASTTAQHAFFISLKSFLKKYGFDGIDIDW